MRRLILLRHAKSSWENPGLRDFDRPLNKRGKRDAPRMGALLKKHAIKPAVIISSDAKRAQSTARLVAAELDYPADHIRLNHALYLSSPATMLEVLTETAPDDSDVMLVAHNPGMTDLANYLSDASIDNLPTCGVFIVTQEANSWNELGNSSANFSAFYCPKQDLA